MPVKPLGTSLSGSFPHGDLDALWALANTAEGDAQTAIADAAAASAKVDAAVPGGGRTVTTLVQYLLNNALYNVKDFGAIGNGIADDTAAIQATMTAAGTGAIYIPPGTYKITAKLVATCSIYGMGALSILKGTDVTKDIVEVRSTPNMVLRDFAIYGAATPGTIGGNLHRGVYCEQPTAPPNLVIMNVLFSGPADGVGLGNPIWLTGAQNAWVTGNAIRRVQGQNTSNGIMLTGPLVVGGAVASAATLPLPAAGNYFRVTGAVNISAIDEGLNPATVITVAFAGTLTVVNGANLQLLDGNYVTTPEVSAGYPSDFLIFQKVSAGVWKQIAYHPQTCNFCVIADNDLVFETGAADAARMGYTGIAQRTGGTGNIFRGNSVQYCTAAQISIVSTTSFLDANRNCVITENRLTNLLALVVSPHGFQEAACELGGRSIGCVVSKNVILRPYRYGLWIAEDGTENSHRDCIVSENTVQDTTFDGMVVLGTSRTRVSKNVFINCGRNSANTRDGIFVQPQPVSGALGADDLLFEGNLIYGPVWTRYGFNIHSPGGAPLFAHRITLVSNTVIANTAGILDEGYGTKRVTSTSNARLPFTNELSGLMTSADNTTTPFLRLSIPNAKVAGVLVITYVLNSNQILKVRGGEVRVTFGRTTGQDTGMNLVETLNDEVALPGGAEAFTTVTFAVSVLTGSAVNPQTFDVTALLNSDSNLQTDLHWRAELLVDSYNGATLADEIQMAQV